MKTKTIKQILSSKHKKWLGSIEDEEVREIARNGTFITGGAVASLLMEGSVNDLDIYFKDTYTGYKVVKYYLDKWNERNSVKKGIIEVDTVKNHSEESIEKFKGGKHPIKIVISSSGIIGEPKPLNEAKSKQVDDAETPKYRPIYMTDNAITLSGDVQLVLRFVGAPEDIHTNFDFVHCTCWYLPSSNSLGMPKEAVVSMMTKELVYTGSRYPLCSLFRMRKFINRGFTVNAGQILKMVFQLQELDLTDLNVLKEQLIGVDTTYMLWFIEAIDEWKKDHEGVDLNAGYLTDLVDKVFSDNIE